MFRKRFIKHYTSSQKYFLPQLVDPTGHELQLLKISFKFKSTEFDYDPI